MSTDMLTNIEDGTPYQQSVVDDAEAFLNVAFWATLFNTTHAGRSNVEQRWRRELRSGRATRYSAHAEIIRSNYSELSNFLEVFRPVLGDWREHIERRPAAPKKSAQQVEPLRRDLEQQTHAVEFVLAFVNILLKHYKDLIAT